MPKSNRYGLILAGGRGTRFWPRSRTLTPKQLLRFLDEGTLLEHTVERLRPEIPPERIWILTTEQLRKPIAKLLPEVPPRQILAEPAQRNTAPCLGLASQLISMGDPDAVLGVFPADHQIDDAAEFRKLLKPAFAAAERGYLATIGIEARHPETGFGYLEFPARAGAGKAVPLRRFHEKPDLKTAKRFLAAGRFYWNAGIFFWRAAVFQEALRNYLPRTASLLASLPPLKNRRFTARLRDTYPRCENISVDYAVMEKAAQAGKVWGVPAGNIGWSDLGSWNAVYELLPKDPDGNSGRGEIVALDSHRCYVESQGKLVALAGVEDLIVVDTPDALLIVRREQAQRVGDVVKLLEKAGRGDLL
ncbi:MAG: mannose-1-phosphate guanylyltransferase [Acidimicrobiia bacterium]|nr:mannose-1-phosphate guanylyltransferase [Acidimicrobiia bacterium]